VDTGRCLYRRDHGGPGRVSGGVANSRIALDPHASLADLRWITDAYMLTGLHSAMVVASAAAGIGALLALFATGGRDADAV
jgi:hypothetical protein